MSNTLPVTLSILKSYLNIHVFFFVPSRIEIEQHGVTNCHLTQEQRVSLFPSTTTRSATAQTEQVL